MQNTKLLIGVVGGTLIAVLGIAYLFSQESTSEPRIVDASVLEADRRHVSGQVAATESAEPEATQAAESEATEKVTMVEFSDFQCPACRAASPLIKSVLEQNPDSVELVYRHFPLEQIHQNARAAAIASEAAARQDAFWEYHDLLFEFQPDWAEESNPREMFIEYAQQLELDVEQFTADLDDPELDDLVEQDLRTAYTLGVSSTPTLFVEGEQVENLNQLPVIVSSKLTE